MRSATQAGMMLILADDVKTIVDYAVFCYPREWFLKVMNFGQESSLIKGRAWYDDFI